MRPYMVKVYIKERINDQTTICSGGVTGNTTYLGPKRRENARNTNLGDEQFVHVLASAIKEATPYAVSGKQPNI